MWHRRLSRNKRGVNVSNTTFINARMTSQIGLSVRQATAEDAVPLCRILNDIIAIGGTTALESPLSVVELNDHYISGPDCFVCFLAETPRGEALGFQTLVASTELPKGWADIGTFTKRVPRVPGVGTQLFEYTKSAARALGLSAINATIRADNRGGLAYYEKMGFEPKSISRGVSLADGTPVDRISKVYSLLPGV